MDITAGSDQGDVKAVATVLLFPKSWWGRALSAAYVIVVPVLSFRLIGKPAWQSGNLSDYVNLLLMPEASLVFLFLLAYSILCYLFLLASPERCARWFLIRFGIYTGVLLAFQYSVMLMVFSPSLPVLWILPLLFAALYRWGMRKRPASKPGVLLSGLLFGALLAIALIAGDANALVYLPLFALLATGPIVALLLAWPAAIWLFRNYEAKPRLLEGLGMAAWLGSYIVAWRFDVLKMYELYAALPMQPPCYIATAAARGHPQIVHSWIVQRAEGKSMRVNRQLQRLKCAELALMALQPQLHRVLRQIYDVLGKHLARRIQNAFLADTAYLLLKPWEWSAVFLLKRLIPEIEAIAKKMYMEPGL